MFRRQQALWTTPRLFFDLSICRGLMSIGSEMADRAKVSTLDDQPSQQLEDAEQALYKLAETGKYGGGFKTFRSAITEAIELANAAVKRDGGLAGVATGMRDLDRMMGGLHPSDLVILAGRPSMGKTALGTNIAVNAAKALKTEKQPDGSLKAVEGAIVGLFSTGNGRRAARHAYPLRVFKSAVRTYSSGRCGSGRIRPYLSRFSGIGAAAALY